ncbi:uncharacterized protein LOC112460793 isoform X4 [Temnothorax curvispinosus]|uniref:Uncharacterized protein LOC112460793 isoform X4 n=1 Tax=Temnothorax curvispinosus TaxID=300111 RepID=A0A6J1QHV5_9HYME|nr:uncharacterized protein LOC112460793 isoform X4 [Temnothorax curvispinosus]
MISPTSLLAVGVASGIFLYFGFRSRKNSKARETKQRVVVDDGRCACCLAPFLVGRGVRCSDCGARSCRKACSRWDTSDNAWHCIFCHQQRSWLKRNDKWFDNFGGTANEEEELHGYFGAIKSRVYVAGHATTISNVEQIQEDREERRMVHAVRNFVEKIVDGLVENVDDTPIDRLYGDSEYDSFLEEYRPPLIAALTRLATCLKASLTNKPSTDPPAMAHAALREIVERAVEEARKLPGLSASADPPEHPPEGRVVGDNSYEDLLATAILNKVVIERYQRERVDGNSNVLHDTDSPKAKYTANENEHGLEEDATSYASERLTCNGDHSAAIRRNEDRRKPVSFTMEERIEEVTTITSDDDELRDNDALALGCTRRVPFPEYGMDIVDPPRELPSPSPSSSSDSSDLNRNEYSPVRTKRHAVGRTIDIVSPIESWEDNWLFQKKKTSRSQPDAVAMLVPSSNAYYKALIGDRDAEDTSDLSECSSTKSDEEIEKELMEAINNVIPRTPKISECDGTNNQTKSNQEGATTTQQFEKDEVDTCQAKTENNVTISECRGGKNHEGLLKSSEISEKKINERKDDESNRNESLFALTTVAKEGDKTKEKHKDTVERGERTIATAVESSAQKEVKVQSEKSSERSDRGENVADENEEQQESEYTEHYDTAIQRHLDSLTKVEVCSGESETIDETRKTTDEQPGKLENNSIKELKSERSETGVQLSYATIDENHADVMSENDPLSAPPRPGTIAEREHKKWENAPPIENNPYSEESIRKRCLERQYSRNSDMPGAHYELTKLNEVNLETLLTASRPDIKRFGRDYYINQSKMASGERQEQAKSAMSSMSSRPSSSLSQRSSCAGDEQHERQEESASKEIDDGISVLQSDKDTKTSASWHRNNAEVISPETNNRAVISRAPVDVGDHQKVRSETNAPDKTTWKDQRADDILENQRKNSKNEINAKLNNQEQSVETERKDDKERIVRRIDLKAYGFANEFSDHQKMPTRQQRMVNRLDLSSFGYQDGLRRARSNNQLQDQPLRNNAKSNLTRRAYKGHLNDTPRSLGWDFAKSSGGLNELRDEVEEMNSRLTSAKSMPNVADDVCYYANPVYVNDTQDELIAKNLLDLAEESATTEKRDAIIGDDISLLNDYDEIPPDVDRSFEDIYIRTKAESGETDDESRAMPSVKRLAEAFGRRQTSEIETAVPAKIIRASMAKVDDAKDRSFTPEVQIVETPRQMHSLTARSLSREFREGLRQMPGKLTSPPVSRSLIEERPTNRTEVVRSKQEGNDTAVISPGKLKSNIIFWEQMQKRN